MKATYLSALCLGAVLFSGAAWAQLSQQLKPSQTATLPSLPDDKVVATFTDGSSMTMGELRTFIGLLDPQAQQASMADLQGYLDKLCLARKLQQMAIEDKLEQSSPIREQILLERMQVLDQAEVNKLSNPPSIDGGELEAFYTTNKAKYEQVKLDDIYIGFSLSDQAPAPGEQKMLTKAEARAKIMKILEQVKGGADFKKLATENSEDGSRTKDGYFETLSPADNGIPDVVRNAIFRLETGQVTDVIEQPAGFYIFKAEEVKVKPFSEVRDQVYTELKQQRFGQIFEGLRRENKAQVIPELLKKDDPKK